MAIRPIEPRSQRLTVLATVTGLHCLALLAILSGNADVPPLPVESGALSVVSLKADDPAQTPPPPPTLPSKIADQNEPPRELAMSNQPDSTAMGAPVAGCATLEVVANALMADRTAVDAVYRAPAETRSIAGAVVMWNAGWSSAARTIDAPLGPVRAVAQQSLGLVDEGCLEEEIAGPRLVPMYRGDSTMFVVFGSGIWRWRDLVPKTDSALQFYDETPETDFWPF